MRRFMRSFRYGEKGFTLIELLIVVAILGILAAVIVPNLAGFLGTGEVAAANTEVANVETAALAYYADNDGTWPTDSDALYNADPALSYLSADTKYATYTFDSFGKVTGATEKAAADSIEWDTTTYQWKKSASA